MNEPTRSMSTRYLRTAVIAVAIVLAFVASYQLAVAAGNRVEATPGTTASAGGFKNACPAQQTGAGTSGASSADPGTGPVPLPGAAGGCCGGAGAGETVEGAATLEGDVQRVTVDTSAGYYQPNYITLKAGVPAEITFTQSGGCLAEVLSDQLGFYADLTSGDQTVSIAGDLLTPGTYTFSCGMRMVYGTIIVE